MVPKVPKICVCVCRVRRGVRVTSRGTVGAMGRHWNTVHLPHVSQPLRTTQEWVRLRDSRYEGCLYPFCLNSDRGVEGTRRGGIGPVRLGRPPWSLTGPKTLSTE